jgi:hypothetical protein
MGSLFAAGLLCLGATAAHAATLTVSNPEGDPGTQVEFTVTLTADGAAVAIAGHRSMTTTKQYVHLAGVVFRDEAALLEHRMFGVPVPSSGT